MSVIFDSKNTAELLKIAERENAAIIGAGTAIEKIPDSAVTTLKIEELQNFEKWDRFFSLGSALALSELEDKSEKNLPPLLFDAIKTIANRAVRNCATIGGNVLCRKNGIFGTLVSPLLALDAKLEFANYERTKPKIVSMTRFRDFERHGELLTKIIIPNEDWQYKIFKRLGKNGVLDENSSSFSFLATTDSRVVTAIRIALCGKIFLRNIELENAIIGQNCPFGRDFLDEIVLRAEKIFDEEIKDNKNALLKAQFLNLVENALERL